jgi:hypothetical protein
VFYENKSTDKLGIAYGGEERPLTGELSLLREAIIAAEEAEMRAEQDRRNAIHQQETLRELERTLPQSWHGFVRLPKPGLER